jgi:hypothetical protein
MDSSNAQSGLALNPSINAAQLDQRAWIAMGNARITMFSAQGGIDFTFDEIDTGKTPGLHIVEAVKVFTLIQNLESPPPKELEGLISRFKYYSTGSIGPGGRTPVSIPRDDVLKLAIMVDPIKARQQFLLIMGNIKYDDVFRRPHNTEFCMRLVDIETLALAQCSSYTDMY